MIIAYHSHSNYEQLYIYIYDWHDLVPIHTRYQKRHETNVYAAARWQLLLNVTALQTTPCLLCKSYVICLATQSVIVSISIKKNRGKDDIPSGNLT
jgi:hypothetical protein